MPKTDHPKYVALVGQLNYQSEPAYKFDLFRAVDDSRVEIYSDDNYPKLSSRANNAFGRMAETTSPPDAEDATPLGTDLYVRVRDVGPVVAAARKLVELSKAGPLEDLVEPRTRCTNELAEALKKVEDLQP